MRPWAAIVVALLVAALLGACGPKGPVRIGFIGGLTGRTADTGEEARNGAILAVEQGNQAGGVNGRMIELDVRDDEQDAQQGQKAVRALIERGVVAVVGPLTSSMAVATLPLAEEAQVIMISPYVSAMDFVGKDDHMFRINSSTRDYAGAYAHKLHARGQRRLAAAYNRGNAAYARSWVSEFRDVTVALGGEVVAEVPFDLDDATPFGAVVRTMLEARPDGLVFIASAVDAARLAQQAAKLAPELPRAAAEFAATLVLGELGGKAVEGMLVAHGNDTSDPGAPYRAFHAAYVSRFGHEPGPVAMGSHDAVRTVLQALTRQVADETLKQALLRNSPYAGLRQEVRFDRYGDAVRRFQFKEWRQGRLEPVP